MYRWMERLAVLHAPVRQRGLRMDGPVPWQQTRARHDRPTRESLMNHATTPRVAFHHAPHTRSTSTLMLLEELGAQYDMHLLDLAAGENRRPAFLKVNPMGKVPAIAHLGELITERPAIFVYLADLYPEAGLAPALSDPLRGPYLRWLSFYGGCFEPAVVDRHMKREPAPTSFSPYGDFDTVIDTVDAQLAGGPWLLGERFTAADVLWANALSWALGMGLVPRRDVFEAYVDRLMARPAIRRAADQDEALARAQRRTAA